MFTTSHLNIGGVPGGVSEGELQRVESLLGKGGIHLKQRLLGLGPKFTPPQVVHGGVGGGVHGGEPLFGGGGCCSAGVGGGDGCDVNSSS